MPTQLPRRLRGSVELRSERGAGLTAVISADEWVLAPLGGLSTFGNEVALQVRKAKIEAVDEVLWSARIFESLCSALHPVHGTVYACDEYDAKNMSHEGGRLEATGVDASKHLPGLYWLNFFGRAYCDFIGRDRLLASPAAEVREVGDGVLLRLADDPRMWRSSEYKAVEERVLNHIGGQYFFSKDHPNRETVAPSFA